MSITKAKTNNSLQEIPKSLKDSDEFKGCDVHLLKAPAGYARGSTEYHVPESYGDLNIVLKAA